LPYDLLIRRKNSKPAYIRTATCTPIAPINQPGIPVSSELAGGLSGKGVLVGAKVETELICIPSVALAKGLGEAILKTAGGAISSAGVVGVARIKLLLPSGVGIMPPELNVGLGSKALIAELGLGAAAVKSLVSKLGLG
jgi:hypothetical protein